MILDSFINAAFNHANPDESRALLVVVGYALGGLSHKRRSPARFHKPTFRSGAQINRFARCLYLAIKHSDSWVFAKRPLRFFTLF